MRRLSFMALSTLVLLAAVGVTNSYTRGMYGDDVDNFCKDSNPYNGDCSLCHAQSSRSTITAEMTSYAKGDLCTFCPSDSSCSAPACTDFDGDGFYSGSGCGTPVDCNDSDRLINPGMLETGALCSDNKDNNCNGSIDQQDSGCYGLKCTDKDGDGYSWEGGACGVMDCNDSDAEIYPGAVDICNDGIDQDCSGMDKTKGKACRSAGREGKGKTCSDGLDNDNDGFTDCADDDCMSSRSCRF